MSSRARQKLCSQSNSIGIQDSDGKFSLAKPQKISLSRYNFFAFLPASAYLKKSSPLPLEGQRESAKKKDKQILEKELAIAALLSMQSFMP